MTEFPMQLPPVPRLALRGITKVYPSVVANDSIDLDVAPGEIHAILGENGAGKSTLVKIIYGVVRADVGEIRWDGRPVAINTPGAARQVGIGMVFHHFSLFETLTVAENISLADPGALRELSTRIAELSQRYGLPVDPCRPVHTLSVGERQRVEIVRCLLQAPKLLILDEPTSVLPPLAVDRLFGTLRQLAAEGCSILYISHKLKEIQSLCHAATVLRAGRVTGTVDPRRESATIGLTALAQVLLTGVYFALSGLGVRVIFAVPLTFLATISPLQEMKDGFFAEDVFLFQPEPKIQWTPRGTKPSEGDRVFNAPNEPAGMVVHYFLKTAVKEKDKVVVRIADVYGEEMAAIEGKGGAGLQSVVWPMHRPPAKKDAPGSGAAQPERYGRARLVPAGEYVVSLVGGRTQARPPGLGPGGAGEVIRTMTIGRVQGRARGRGEPRIISAVPRRRR